MLYSPSKVQHTATVYCILYNCALRTARLGIGMQIVFSIDFKGPFVPSPIRIIPLLKQALKQCRHCFQINVAISKNASFFMNSPLILYEVCLCGSTPKEEKKKKTGKWKREDREKRENVVACVTKYGEREQLGGHDNYGLIYDSVSVKLGFTGCHRDTFWKFHAKLFIHNVKCYCPQFLFSGGWCTPPLRRAEH